MQGVYFIKPGQQGYELFFFFGVQGVQEAGIDGAHLFIELLQDGVSFFGEAEPGRSLVFLVRFFQEEAFFCQSPGDLDAGGVFDEQFPAKLLFIGVVHQFDLDENGEFHVFGKA